jgi:hypothetical protein
MADQAAPEARHGGRCSIRSLIMRQHRKGNLRVLTDTINREPLSGDLINAEDVVLSAQRLAVERGSGKTPRPVRLELRQWRGWFFDLTIMPVLLNCTALFPHEWSGAVA